MKLIIDIPDKDYEFIRDAHILIGRRSGKTIEYNMINAIKNGTPYEEENTCDEREKGNCPFYTARGDV